MALEHHLGLGSSDIPHCYILVAGEQDQPELAHAAQPVCLSRVCGDALNERLFVDIENADGLVSRPGDDDSPTIRKLERLHGRDAEGMPFEGPARRACTCVPELERVVATPRCKQLAAIESLDATQRCHGMRVSSDHSILARLLLVLGSGHIYADLPQLDLAVLRARHKQQVAARGLHPLQGTRAPGMPGQAHHVLKPFRVKEPYRVVVAPGGQQPAPIRQPETTHRHHTLARAMGQRAHNQACGRVPHFCCPVKRARSHKVPAVATRKAAYGVNWPFVSPSDMLRHFKLLRRIEQNDAAVVRCRGDKDLAVLQRQGTERVDRLEVCRQRLDECSRLRVPHLAGRVA
mmetsp:Transcript_14577/g.46507  ORF Transcript_14577/g.46507 Transcript_14577/m.46507 type:complete len:347 (+) Transcript_14577:754-1794(+)